MFVGKAKQASALAPLLSFPRLSCSLSSYYPFSSPLISLPRSCPQAENEKAEIAGAGCTFWQYNPSETYHVSGLTSEDSVPLEPGRVRFENQGTKHCKSYSALRPGPVVLANVYLMFIISSCIYKYLIAARIIPGSCLSSNVL